MLYFGIVAACAITWLAFAPREVGEHIAKVHLAYRAHMRKNEEL